MRGRVLIVPVFLLAVPVLANSPKLDDEIAAQLLKDKEAYVAAVEKAKGEMLKAFDKHFETVKNNKMLKIDVQLAMLEKIEAEKKAFDENDVPPANVALKVALSEYRTTQKKAEAACKAAFEKAAKAYRDKGELKTAGAILEESKEFLAKTPAAAATPAMFIMCGNSQKVLGLSGGNTDDGTKVVTADYVKGEQTQLWKVVPADDGWAYIENVKTGMVMTANGKNNGTELVIAKKASPASDYQLWKVSAVPGVKDAVRIVPKPSGRPLGVFGKSKDSGARIVIWDDENEPHRVFGFFPPK